MKELDEMISAWTRQRTGQEILETMREAGVPAGKVYTAKDIVEDPHYAARENIVAVEDSHLGPFPMQNVIPRLTETPGEIRWTGPDLGQHNTEVYSGLLELSQEDLGDLRERGII